MKERISHGMLQADAVITDEHASSSYGIPVIVSGGQAYGPADRIRPIDDELYFIAPHLQTAGDVARELLELDEGFTLSQSAREALRKFVRAA